MCPFQKEHRNDNNKLTREKAERNIRVCKGLLKQEQLDADRIFGGTEFHVVSVSTNLSYVPRVLGFRSPAMALIASL